MYRKFTSVHALKSISLLLVMALCVGTIQAQEKNLQYYLNNAPFKMPVVVEPQFAAKTFSIIDFGAIGNGQILNTAAFAKTIEACSKSGGGRVVVPAGLWLTGPIQLQSNIDLHLEKGALILFTPDHSQYPIIKASATSTNFTTASPIYGYDLKNVAITGEGVIDGSGESWRPVKKVKTTASQWNDFVKSGGVVSNDGSVWWPNKEAMEGEGYLKQLKKSKPQPTAEDYLPARDFLRPYMVYLVNCKNVLVEGVTIRNSPKFIFYPNHCTNVTLRNATFFNEWWAQNGDAIDISACKNVLIYKCKVSAGDDGICMKSSGGKNDDPANANLENVIVAGCEVYHAHGGFVIGSNTDGGMRNVFVSDCNFVGTDVGIRVKSNAGRGGLVKDIFIKNIYMANIENEAVLFDTYYEDVPAGTQKDSVRTVLRDKTPEFRDFHISNVFCNGAKTAIALTGLPEMPVHNIYFDSVTISAEKGFVATDAADIHLKNVKIISVKDPVYTVNNSKNIFISQGYFPADAKTFIKAEGTRTAGIKISGTPLPKTNTVFKTEAGLDKSVINVTN